MNWKIKAWNFCSVLKYQSWFGKFNIYPEVFCSLSSPFLLQASDHMSGQSLYVTAAFAAERTVAAYIGTVISSCHCVCLITVMLWDRKVTSFVTFCYIVLARYCSATKKGNVCQKLLHVLVSSGCC
jgi:hypothetical protein